MPTELLSIPEYAKKYTKVKRHAVLKSVKAGKMKLLPRVIEIKKVGRCYALLVSTT
jgi:hypothetical protein